MADLEAQLRGLRAGKIRRMARAAGLTARKARSNGRWYIIDARDVLISPEQGMTDEDARCWLDAETEDDRPETPDKEDAGAV